VADQWKLGPSGPSPLAEVLTPEFVRLLNDLNQAFTVMGAHLLMFAEKTPEYEARVAAEEAFRLSRGLMADAMHRARPSGRADLCKCTRSMIRMMGPVHRAYRTQLSIPLTPLWVPIDTIVLRRLVMNLFLNALEVSPPDNPVLVQVFRTGDRGSLVLDDAGTGIEGITRNGLGLALVHDVVRDAGGYLSFASSQRGGTRVVVDLPVVPAPGVLLPPESE
jgi:C4-dicarboxylate-specific signal transduction histidine kinase